MTAKETPGLPLTSNLSLPAEEAPAPPSINNLLRQNPRELLYVHPILWTNRQLDLLHCEFAPGQNFGKECSGTAELRELVEDCPPHWALSGMSLLIKNVLRLYGIEKWDKRLLFLFGQRNVASLPAGVFSQDTNFYANTKGGTLSDPSGVPALAYLNLMSLQCEQPPRFSPRLEYENPYIAGVLIALAQQRRRRLPRAEANIKVFLLVYSDSTSEPIIYFYRAVIPFAFLDRFDKPSANIPCEKLTIWYHTIPVQADPIAQVLTGVREELELEGEGKGGETEGKKGGNKKRKETEGKKEGNRKGKKREEKKKKKKAIAALLRDNEYAGV